MSRFAELLHGDLETVAEHLYHANTVQAEEISAILYNLTQHVIALEKRNEATDQHNFAKDCAT